MKKILNKTLFGLMLVSFGISTWSCKKEKPSCQDPTNPTCENYDPCYGKKTINTFFKVRPGDNGFKPPEEWCDLIPCDTFNASSVRFDIPDGNPANSTYEWQIGTEATSRTGKAFEISFDDYLRDNGWERHIPITLTIRTPMNECLQSEDETVKVVKRDLFFTKEHIVTYFTQWHWEDSLYEVRLKGYWTSNPNQILELKYIKLKDNETWEGKYTTYKSPWKLIIGIPGKDTILHPEISTCGAELCGNYKNARIKFLSIDKCPFSEDSKYLEHIDILYYNSSRLKLIYTFNRNGKIEQHEFIGEKQ